ncbi:MAG: uracil-DNA glycosylase [Hyphomonadaceae bacterium]
MQQPTRDCPLCPRLVAYRANNRLENPDWYNGPAPSFGDGAAWLLIVGLAPGRTGANRTGRPFTGDWAGDLLYQTLARFDLSSGTYAAHADDGLVLKGVMIANAVQCAPPANKPEPSEIAQCAPFLQAQIGALPKLRSLICLGKISHDATIRALGAKPSAYKFAHGGVHQIGDTTVYDSYHCSRYNTNTGRLTPDMFEAVFAKALADRG